MTQVDFLEIAKKENIKPNHFLNIIKAFLMGGFIGFIGQGLFLLFNVNFKINEENASLLVTFTIIIMTMILTITGTYKKLAKKVGAGLFIPITGFANSVIASALESQFEGPIFGLGSRLFYLAGSVITFGVTSAFFYSLLHFLLQNWGLAL